MDWTAEQVQALINGWPPEAVDPEIGYDSLDELPHFHLAAHTEQFIPVPLVVNAHVGTGLAWLECGISENKYPPTPNKRWRCYSDSNEARSYYGPTTLHAVSAAVLAAKGGGT